MPSSQDVKRTRRTLAVTSISETVTPTASPDRCGSAATAERSYADTQHIAATKTTHHENAIGTLLCDQEHSTSLRPRTLNTFFVCEDHTGRDLWTGLGLLYCSSSTPPEGSRIGCNLRWVLRIKNVLPPTHPTRHTTTTTRAIQLAVITHVHV